MGERRNDREGTWTIAERTLLRNAEEDAEAAKLLSRFRALCARRAGRLINEFFWAWCAGCGAVSTLCRLHERRLVDGRASGLCGDCRPAPENYAALGVWQAKPEAERKAIPYREIATRMGGKSIEAHAVRAAFEHLLPEARVAAAETSRRGLYLSPEHQAVLTIATDADRAILEAALAKINARTAEAA